MRSVFTITSLLILLFAINIYSQTGKLTGYVKDAATKEALLGVNVVVEGTKLGAATNAEGYYVILNVPPGIYSLKASMVGYAPKTLEDVRVNISQTTETNFDLSDVSLTTEEVVIVAKAPVVQKDVSASTVNLNIEDIKNMPVTTVSNVVNLQAGISGGVIRGGGSDQTNWMLNGVNLKDERTNQPYTGMSMTSVEEVQVLTGGYNAEYGDARSGIINVVTKEGKSDKFSVNFIGSYSPTRQKHFGGSPNSADSYWMKPFVDDNICWTGSLHPKDSTSWDQYTRKQYPEFEGWNSISQTYMTSDDPSLPHLSPEALQKLYLYQHRKNNDISKPDYNVDMSVGGYIPKLSKMLGNLRFLFSYRGTREMYIVPLSRDAYTDNNYQLRVTSDLLQGAQTMKLSVEGLLADTKGTTASSTGAASIFRDAGTIASYMGYDYVGSNAKSGENRLFTYDYWCPTDIKRNSISAKLTHVINPTTFYDFTISRFESKYNTNPGRGRDTTSNVLFGNGYYVDEAPFGFIETPTTGVGNFRMSVGFSNSRDTSKIRTYTAKLDFVSQIDKYNNIKTGFEFKYSENLANYAYIDKYLPSGKYRSCWSAYPIKGAFYVQDKLEFEGMIANLGVRFDYSDPNIDWYVYDTYTMAFASENSLGLDTLLKKESVKSKLTVSPRLGVAFPITETSKLYFNYGHFRQLPTPDNLYLLRRYLDNNLVVYVANPNADLPKTVQYELGYEQSFFDQYLIKIAGYYKDVSQQPLSVTYTSRNGKVSYSTALPNSYADIRGFEITANKNRGDWVRGFVNYTYMVSSSGRFGYANYYENPADQRNYETKYKSDYYQSKPKPQPYGRINLDIFTPSDWDPFNLGTNLVTGDWTLNILGYWSSGFYFTWTGGGGSIPGVQNNVQWKDNWALDLRFAKNFSYGPVNLQLFVDIKNALNLKQMDSDYGFSDTQDWLDYMKSLHLSKDAFSNFPKDPVTKEPKPGYFNDKNSSKYVYGDDKPGDYRKGPYIPWDDNASDAQKEEWKKNKSYIDMPNQTYFTFLNPRDIYFGVRFSFEF